MRNLSSAGLMSRGRLVAPLLAALVVAACGGGGGGSVACLPYETNTNCTPTSGGSTGSTQTATQMALTVDTPTIQTNGSSVVTLSATLKDAQNAVVEGQTVTFTADSGTISASSAKTDANGVASITFNSNADKTNRIVKLTATAGNLIQTTVVQVRGTRIGFGGDTSATVGKAASISVTLLDGANKAIAFRDLSLASKLGNAVPASATTDGNGQAVIVFTPTVSGVDTITVSALGAVVPQDILISSVVNFTFDSPVSGSSIDVNQCTPVLAKLIGPTVTGAVFSVSRGQVYKDSACSSDASLQTIPFSGSIATAYVKSPNAGSATVYAELPVGSAAVAKISQPLKFVATTPSTVVLQGDPSVVTVNSSSTITAIVRDASGNPVSGRSVSFSAPNGGGTLNPTSALTNDSGSASMTFTADSTVSGKDSVQIVATVAGVAPVTTTLTVAGSAVSIVIGTDNLIVPITDPPRYRKVYGVIVSDSASGPIKNQTVTISLRGIGFKKGCFIAPLGTATSCTSGGGVANTYTQWTEYPSATKWKCPAEDYNNNGSVESNELGDVDGDGILEPDGAAIVRAPTASGGLSATVTTDDSGAATFYVEYLREYANWAEVELKATASVAGKNSVAVRSFYLPVPASELLDKDVSPSFQFSPFGIQSGCSNPH